MKTEHSDGNLIKVNQHDIKALLEERVLNPKKYADRPLLIWRSYFEDDIQRKVFFDFEPRIKELIHKQQQYFLNSNDGRIHMGKDEVAIPRWITLNLYNLRDNAYFLPDKGSNTNRVFCFFFDFPEEDLVKPPLYKKYSDIINSDWLIREKEFLNSPLVVYLPFLEEPEAFKGYDQCVFTPDFEQWKENFSDIQVPLIKHLIWFLESSKSKEERNYRWYWYFQRLQTEECSTDLKSNFKGSGCDFPSCWIEGIWNLRGHFILPMAQIPKNYIPPKPTKISEIPMEEFKAFFKEVFQKM